MGDQDTGLTADVSGLDDGENGQHRSGERARAIDSFY